MQTCKIFYSWQSDLPNPTNRGFIQTALEKAIKSIRNDESIQVEPAIDRDTQGVPGSPDIANTIFDKIDQAAVFVCDVSIVGDILIKNQDKEPRPTPNPNVLIELGYAFKSLGPERVIMVMNTEFGEPEKLPFDLRMKRVLTYKVTKELENKANERKKIEKIFKDALSSSIKEDILQKNNETTTSPSIVEQAIIAVENDKPNQELLVRKFMEYLVDQLDAIAPDFKEPVGDQMIIDSIDKTVDIAVEFSRLAEMIASMKASDAAMSLYKGFEEIINRYSTPDGFEGRFYELAFDFYKFIGHEFFVIFFSFLIREQRWDIVAETLSEYFYCKNPYTHKYETRPFTEISSYLKSLRYRNQRLNLNRVSIHADLLNERHTEGKLSKIVPMEQFIDAYFFLFIRAEINKSEEHLLMYWNPFIFIYIQKIPRYFIEADRYKNAARILEPLNIESVEELRKSMIDITSQIRERFAHGCPLTLAYFNPQAIGTK